MSVRELEEFEFEEVFIDEREGEVVFSAGHFELPEEDAVARPAGVYTFGRGWEHYHSVFVEAFDFACAEDGHIREDKQDKQRRHHRDKRALLGHSKADKQPKQDGHSEEAVSPHEKRNGTVDQKNERSINF